MLEGDEGVIRKCYWNGHFDVTSVSLFRLSSWWRNPQVRPTPTLSVIAAYNLAFNAFLITLDVQSDNGMTRWKKAPIEAHRLSQARAVNRFIIFFLNWQISMQLTDSLHRVWNSTRSYFVYTQGNDVIPLFFCDSIILVEHISFLLSNSWNFTLRILSVSNQNYNVLFSLWVTRSFLNSVYTVKANSFVRLYSFFFCWNIWGWSVLVYWWRT